MEWKCTLAIRSYDWLEWFCQLCVCMFVWSCLHTEQDRQQSPVNKTRVKLPLSQASSSVIQNCLRNWKMFRLGVTTLYSVSLVASTADELRPTVTLTKKRQLIPKATEQGVYIISWHLALLFLFNSKLVTEKSVVLNMIQCAICSFVAAWGAAVLVRCKK